MNAENGKGLTKPVLCATVAKPEQRKGTQGGSVIWGQASHRREMAGTENLKTKEREKRREVLLTP